MRTDELAKMHALDRTHWWFLGRRYLLRSLLPILGKPGALILDAGCGTGLATSELRSLGKVVALDVCDDVFKLGEWEALGVPCLGSVLAIPFQDCSFDLVVALDVLEHISNDVLALQEIYRVCKPGGTVLLTVPAYQWLWSSHDEVLNHKRRYTASLLANHIRAAGFEIRKLSYAVSGVFALAAVLRLAGRLIGRKSEESDLAPMPRFINRTLAVLMRAEAFILRYFSLPFGLSVLAIVEKPAHTEVK